MNFNLLSGGTYLANRYPTILWLEETGKEHLTPYNDGKGNVTIGVGFNLADATVRGLVLAKMGMRFPRFFVCQRVDFMLPVFPDVAC